MTPGQVPGLGSYVELCRSDWAALDLTNRRLVDFKHVVNAKRSFLTKPFRVSRDKRTLHVGNLANRDRPSPTRLARTSLEIDDVEIGLRRFWVSAFMFSNSRFHISGFRFQASGFWFRVSGFGFLVSDVGSRVLGFGFGFRV